MEGRRAAGGVVDKVDEVVAGGLSTKALDPCLETGEVGERPVEAVSGKVVEKVVESPVEAVPNKVVEKVEEVVEKVALAAARHSMSLGRRGC